MSKVLDIKKEMKKMADPEKARILQRFFKTEPGQYGEGDIFLGIIVPKIRIVARKHRKIKLSEASKLLKSKIHEERLLAVFILVDKFQAEAEKKKIVDLYLKNTRYINNWDLVDLSAGKIIGAYFYERPKKILHKLARSKNLWERRIAIIATSYFIGKDKFNDTLKISEILLSDRHNLIHKAVGWMLRETGKRSQRIEEGFLKKHYKKMPRTMLRYAIEKFSEKLRKAYLTGNV
jgi:3-methyladenine DNA glycosylase AlkD